MPGARGDHEPPATRSAPTLTDLGPIAQLRAGQLGRRLPQLLSGLVIYGISLAMMVRGAFGLAPWDVLHSGLTHYLPLALGQVIILVSFVVLVAWVPLREKPGIGTVANAVIIGLAADAMLAVLAPVDHPGVRVALTVGGVVLNALATAMYIGSQLGRGPRDGLMTSISRHTGWSLRLVRTGLEVGVVAIGLVLGGALGVGTVLYALAIGPLTQLMLPPWTVDLDGLPPLVSGETHEAV